MGCVQIIDKRAHHSYARCVSCLACIHACPQKAIRFAALTEKNPGVHYRNPHVSPQEFMAANNQNG